MTINSTTSPEKPLHGRRILITRAEEDGADLKRELQRLGADVAALAVIAFDAPEDVSALDAVLRDLPHYDWIAFTSRNAVRALFGRLQTLGLDAGLPPGVKLAAVGRATQGELTLCGASVDCVPLEATASALADAMADMGVADTDVLVPQGNLALPDLQRGLERAGARVHPIVVYRTVKPTNVPADSLRVLEGGRLDAITLASPSAARNLVEMLGEKRTIMNEIPLVCIGPTTAEAVDSLGLQPAVIAEDHSAGGLVRAVVSLFSMEIKSDHESAHRRSPDGVWNP